jgi:hypothetical protein
VTPSSSVNCRKTVPIKVGVKIPVADPTLKIESTSSPEESYLSLQIRPVAELSLTQNDVSVSKNERSLSCVDAVNVEYAVIANRLVA